ncbi:MAG TPA: PH domain-containing protein [Catalimonadaceae bacterium]|nr:PH domain-containing protein [Catalimonadaceae bacterium]
MPTFTASRLTGGNRIFPDEITINDLGVTLKEPGLFSGEEKTIPFTRISSVEIDCPLIGFSTITIQTTGEGGIVVDGFTKDEVTEMKQLIIDKIS